MEEIINLIVNNGIGIVCMGYIIFSQSTTMKTIENTLNSINERLILIEEKVGLNK